MKIQFLNHQEWAIEPALFKTSIGRLKKAIDSDHGIFNVIFVNDPYIQALNKQYRGKDQPTDVLSFNYGEHSEVAGEIYISVETAKRQAKAFGWPLKDELNKLFVHGILHLHGYDHEKDEDYKIMHAIECKVLGKNMT